MEATNTFTTHRVSEALSSSYDLSENRIKNIALYSILPSPTESKAVLTSSDKPKDEILEKAEALMTNLEFVEACRLLLEANVSGALSREGLYLLGKVARILYSLSQKETAKEISYFAISKNTLLEIANHPEFNDKAYFELGLLYELAKDLEKAIEFYQKIKNPSEQILLKIASFYKDKGDLTSAFFTFAKIYENVRFSLASRSEATRNIFIFFAENYKIKEAIEWHLIYLSLNSIQNNQFSLFFNFYLEKNDLFGTKALLQFLSTQLSSEEDFYNSLLSHFLNQDPNKVIAIAHLLEGNLLSTSHYFLALSYYKLKNYTSCYALIKLFNLEKETRGDLLIAFAASALNLNQSKEAIDLYFHILTKQLPESREALINLYLYFVSKNKIDTAAHIFSYVDKGLSESDLPSLHRFLSEAFEKQELSLIQEEEEILDGGVIEKVNQINLFQEDAEKFISELLSNSSLSGRMSSTFLNFNVFALKIASKTCLSYLEGLNTLLKKHENSESAHHFANILLETIIPIAAHPINDEKIWNEILEKFTNLAPILKRITVVNLENRSLKPKNVLSSEHLMKFLNYMMQMHLRFNKHPRDILRKPLTCFEVREENNNFILDNALRISINSHHKLEFKPIRYKSKGYITEENLDDILTRVEAKPNQILFLTRENEPPQTESILSQDNLEFFNRAPLQIMPPLIFQSFLKKAVPFPSITKPSHIVSKEEFQSTQDVFSLKKELFFTYLKPKKIIPKIFSMLIQHFYNDAKDVVMIVIPEKEKDLLLNEFKKESLLYFLKRWNNLTLSELAASSLKNLISELKIVASVIPAISFKKEEYQVIFEQFSSLQNRISTFDLAGLANEDKAFVLSYSDFCKNLYFISEVEFSLKKPIFKRSSQLWLSDSNLQFLPSCCMTGTPFKQVNDFFTNYQEDFSARSQKLSESLKNLKKNSSLKIAYSHLRTLFLLHKTFLMEREKFMLTLDMRDLSIQEEFNLFLKTLKNHYQNDQEACDLFMSKSMIFSELASQDATLQADFVKLLQKRGSRSTAAQISKKEKRVYRVSKRPSKKAHREQLQTEEESVRSFQISLEKEVPFDLQQKVLAEFEKRPSIFKTNEEVPAEVSDTFDFTKVTWSHYDKECSQENMIIHEILYSGFLEAKKKFTETHMIQIIGQENYRYHEAWHYRMTSLNDDEAAKQCHPAVWVQVIASTPYEIPYKMFLHDRFISHIEAHGFYNLQRHYRKKVIEGVLGEENCLYFEILEFCKTKDEIDAEAHFGPVKWNFFIKRQDSK